MLNGDFGKQYKPKLISFIRYISTLNGKHVRYKIEMIVFLIWIKHFNKFNGKFVGKTLSVRKMQTKIPQKYNHHTSKSNTPSFHRDHRQNLNMDLSLPTIPFCCCSIAASSPFGCCVAFVLILILLTGSPVSLSGGFATSASLLRAEDGWFDLAVEVTVSCSG